MSLSLYIFFNIENNIYKNRSIADYIAQIFSDFLFREAHLSQSLFSAATWFLEDQQDDFSHVGNVHKGHHGGENKRQICQPSWIHLSVINWSNGRGRDLMKYIEIVNDSMSIDAGGDGGGGGRGGGGGEEESQGAGGGEKCWKGSSTKDGNKIIPKTKYFKSSYIDFNVDLGWHCHGNWDDRHLDVDCGHCFDKGLI